MDDDDMQGWRQRELEEQEYEMWLYWIDNQYNQYFELTGEFK